MGKVEIWIYHKIRIIGINVGLNQCQIRLISFLNSLSKKQRHRNWDWDGNGTGTGTGMGTGTGTGGQGQGQGLGLGLGREWGREQGLCPCL